MKHDLSDVLTVPSTHAEWFDHDVVPTLLAGCEDITSSSAQEALIRLWVAGNHEGVDIHDRWVYTKNESTTRRRAKTRPEQRERFFDDTWWINYNESPGLLYADGYELYIEDMLLDVPPQQRKLISLWGIEGYSIRSAAQMLNISLRTAERWIANNRELLQSKWRDLY